MINLPSQVDGPSLKLGPSPSVGSFIGIDNGFSGAAVLLRPDDSVLYRLTSVLDLGKEKLLDVDTNLQALGELVRAANGSVLVCYEQCQINPQFGYRNNFTNGKNGEFWRVLLTLQRLSFCWINPRQWQAPMFRGVRGTDTKKMAELVRRQRFPHVDLSKLNREQREGVTDALLIALWAREMRRW